METKKPIVLVSPPPSDPTQPYSSLPMLTGFLRGKGWRVIQIDLGLRLFDECTSAGRLERAKRDAVARMDRREVEPSDSYVERFYGIIGLSDFIAGHVEEAKAIMRDPDRFYDLGEYEWASSILRLACELVSLPNHPTVLTPFDYSVKAPLTFKGLLDATSRRYDNLFYDAFEHEVVPALVAENPLLVGISVTYGSQLVPAFTLSRLLKKAAPDLHVTIGGATISLLESQILRDATCFDYADSYVLGEGETALFSLANNISSGQDPSSGPNIITKTRGETKAGPMWKYEHMEELPPPDFDGLELKSYLTPEPVLLVESTRGCYHAKCAFCNVSMNKKRRYRSNARGQTASMLRGIYQKHGARRFFFCDDAIPLANMLEVSNFIMEEAPSMTWSGEARLESGLAEHILALKNGGCRQLTFGLESASQRVLDLMDKRNTVENDLRILRACVDSGLAVNMQTFIGFPTETREEAMKTIDFLINNKDYLISFGFCTFDLCQDTPVYDNPERFGITIQRSLDEDLFFESFKFEQSSGMTRDEVESLNEEASNRLTKAYRGRTNYLCRTAGAHVLLHLSHYSLEEMNGFWKKKAEGRVLRSALPDDAVVRARPSILTSHPFDPRHSFGHRALDTESGEEFGLSPEEQRLMEMCDGRRSAKEIIDDWVRERGRIAEERTLDLAKAVIMINKLYVNGLIEFDWLE